MANFVQIGNRVLNLERIAAAERQGNSGPVTVYLAGAGGGTEEGAGGAALRWVFDKQDESDTLWIKLTGHNRGDLTDLRGGPYSITDNETTASAQPRSRS